MYNRIIEELNKFLESLSLPANTLDPDAFQGVFVKKLSNQNIIKEKRFIRAGQDVSTTNQTHIDVTSQSGMLFFFESLKDQTTGIQNIDVDLFKDNYEFLKQNDCPQEYDSSDGTRYFKRSSLANTVSADKHSISHSSAYKKYGHTGGQVQINIPDSDEIFTKLHKLAYFNDALIMLRYDYQHYLALLIPLQSCTVLYSMTGTSVNFVALNTSYNATTARQLQTNQIISDGNSETDETGQLQESLLASKTAGTDIERIVKSRVSQGAFRRLLLLTDNHKCKLCNITTTSVLRASHIKEWSQSNKEERMDFENGLLLCANHDALFDRHLISFNPDSGKICISQSIEGQQKESLNLSDSFKLSISKKMKAYMELHYKKYTEKEK